MKKLLFITFLLFTTLSFAQQNGKSSALVKKEVPPTTLTSITASPNPFNIRTTIQFKSSKSQLIEFSVKNLLGKTVYTQQINAEEGSNSINFEKNDISKGMYIYSLQTGTEVVSKRLVIQ